MKLKLDIDEIKRYMGDASEQLDQQVESKVMKYIDWLNEFAHTKYTCRICDFHIEGNKVVIPELNLEFVSDDLIKHLDKCKQVGMFVATLGLNVDQMIHKLEFDKMSDAYIMNAVAIEYVEKFCDYIQKEVEKDLEEYQYMTSRFSCGYGDLALSYQNEIVLKLNATKLTGVSVLENHLMIPSKSVSAMFGIADEFVSNDMAKCEHCLDNGKCSGKCIAKGE